MSWKTNEHGLIEGHEPDNLLAYDNEPVFCHKFTKEEYELLYIMLNPTFDQDRNFTTVRPWMFDPYLAGVLKLNDFDPDKVFEAIRTLPNNASRIGYGDVKKLQALLQQVADEDLPLFLHVVCRDASIRRAQKDTKVLRTVLEWRFKCQSKGKKDVAGK